MTFVTRRSALFALCILASAGLAGCEPQNIGPGISTNATGTLTSSKSTSTSEKGTASGTSTSTSTKQCPASESYVPAPNFSEPVGGLARKGYYQGFAAGCYKACHLNDAACGSGTRCVKAFLPHKATGTGDDMGITAHQICVAQSKGQACAGLEPGIYKDSELKECVSSSGAKTQCHWTIEILADGKFRWTRKDGVHTGEYVCHDGKVFVNVPMRSTAQSRSASFDLSKKSLLWEQVVYQKSPSAK